MFRNILSRINIPNVVATVGLITADRYFDASGKVLRSIGASPKR